MTDGLLSLLELIRDRGLVAGHLSGVFHIAIGRKITTADGRALAGATWRELSHLLKEAKYDKDLVSDLGVDPEALAPKDREKFWYSAIALAKVDSSAARTQADALADLLRPLGYEIGPAPGRPAKPPTARATRQAAEDAAEEKAPAKKKPRKKK